MAAPKRLSPAQIINRLRKAEVALANGNTTKEVCRELGVSEQTYYRWRREYGGMKLSQAKRLKEPSKQPKRGRLWLTDGSCIRLRPLYRHHVWAYDFVADRMHDGRPLKMLTVLDEYSRECLAIVVTRRLQADDVLQTLSELFAEHGPPANLRSDNGPEFTARVVRQWLGELGVKTLFIEPGSPWENGYNESFNGTLRNRAAEARNLLFAGGGKSADRAVAARIQHASTAQLSGLSTPGPRSDPARPKAAQPTSASWTTPQPKGGACTNTLGGTAFGGRSVGSGSNLNQKPEFS